MGLPIEISKYSFEEYLQIEETAVERSEFYFGELFAMAGGTLDHNRIVGNLSFIFRNWLQKKQRKCGVFTENVKLELIEKQYYVYPDMMLICHPLDLQSKRIVQNPLLIVEVLSESTKGYDESTKKDYYLNLSSLNYYILIEQSEALIKVYTRQGHDWLYQTFDGLDKSIAIKGLELNFTSEEVYADVVFGEAEEQNESEVILDNED